MYSSPAFIAAVLSNALVMIPFLLALFMPEKNTHFMYSTAFIIFVIEFLSVHSSSLLMSSNAKTMGKSRLLLVLVYALFAFGFSFFGNSYYPALIFILSLIAKLLFLKSSPQRDSRFIMNVLLIMGTTFFVSIFASPIRDLFPFSAEILNAKPSNASGLYFEIPQTVLVWGLLYYGLNTFIEIRLAKNPTFLSSILNRKSITIGKK